MVAVEKFAHASSGDPTQAKNHPAKAECAVQLDYLMALIFWKIASAPISFA